MRGAVASSAGSSGAQAVEGHAEHPVALARVDGNWAIVSPLTSRTTSSKSMSARTSPAAWARRSSGSPAA